MPQIEPIQIELSDSAGKKSHADVAYWTWTSRDARNRALLWSGGIIGTCVLMIPIPIVHFGIIPVLLVGLPVALVAVYKMYSHGSDLRGDAPCPTCGATMALQKSAEEFPLQINCPKCRASLSISRRG